MDNKLFMSSKGEVKSYNEWRRWAISFYNSLEDKEFTALPHNWFQRVQRVLRLEEVL